MRFVVASDTLGPHRCHEDRSTIWDWVTRATIMSSPSSLEMRTKDRRCSRELRYRAYSLYLFTPDQRVTTKAEQTERTRAALLAAGRASFAKLGYADTSTEELVHRAGVTRGALYHHFKDKRALFEAVYEEVEQDLVLELAAAVEGVTDPLQVLRRGAEAFLDLCLDPAIQRISLLEAPSVLGWARWREIDEHYGLGLIQTSVQAAMDAGAIRRQPVIPLAHVLFGALMEAAMLLAGSRAPGAAREDVGQAVTLLIDGLAGPSPKRRRTQPTRRR